MNEWIKISERVPTKDDADCNGDVWFYCGGSQAAMDRWYECDLDLDTHWMPTNVTRPEPPQ